MRALLIGSIALVACSGPETRGFARPDAELPRFAAEEAGPRTTGVDLWGAPHESATVPPVISGGTLALAPDGKVAVAADPDRDRVHVVDLAAWSKLATIPLNPHDEPGRVVIDNAGRAHVVLRGGGAIVSFALTGGAIERRAVCAAPRGIALDSARGELHVACAGGELVSLAASGGAPRRVLRVGRDLRDVVVDGERLVVTMFRAARVLVLDASGAIVERRAPAEVLGARGSVAWRTIGVPGGGYAMLHQRTTPRPVAVSSGGYGAQPAAPSCPGPIVMSTITRFDEGAPSEGPMLRDVTLAVDVAIDPSRKSFVLAVPGNAARRAHGTIMTVPFGPTDGLCEIPSSFMLPERAEPIAVAFEPSRSWIAQVRQPAALHRADGTSLALDTADRAHTGHTIFHADAGGGLACASCHPEGGDDGLTWAFAPIGKRRTQSLRGGVIGTEPFHWSGDQANLRALAHEVLGSRMAGPKLDDAEVQLLGAFLQTIPHLPQSVPDDPARVARGKQLFERSDVGCASCHGGPRFAIGGSFSVGTFGVFQVPSLRGVAMREPLMHDGCADTLYDRFLTCGGGDTHGHTSGLSLAEIVDLVGYLETL